MKQKLALACALVPQPQVLLLDEPTTGVDPVSRREFWDTLAHLAADGLTILVATPYLDEAERCNRVALMHLGEIRELQTPDGLRESLHAKRLEVRPSDLRRGAERVARDREGRRRSSTCSASATGWTCWPHRPDRRGGARGRGELAGRRPEGRRDSRRRTDAREHFRRNAARVRAGHDGAPFPGASRPPRSARQDRDRRDEPDQALRQLHRCRRTSTSRCGTAKSTACSAPTARARRRRSRCSAACSIPTTATCSWPGERRHRSRRRRPPANRLHVAEVFALRRSYRSTKTSNSSPASTACRKPSATKRCAGCSRSPAWRARKTRSPAACPAAGSSAWRSARRSCTSPACSFSTSRPPASIRSPAALSGA